MKIDPRLQPDITPAKAETHAASKVSDKASSGKTTAPVAQPGEDSAQVSEIAKRVEADPARIEKLREAVRNGTYHVSARDISSKLISEHLDDHQA